MGAGTQGKGGAGGGLGGMTGGQVASPAGSVSPTSSAPPAPMAAGAPATGQAGKGGTGKGGAQKMGANTAMGMGNPQNSLAQNVNNAYNQTLQGYGKNLGMSDTLMAGGAGNVGQGSSILGGGAGMGRNLFGAGMGSIGAGQQLGSDAGDAYSQMLGYAPHNINEKSLGGMSLNRYMNPFTKSVINTTMNKLGRQEGQQQQAIDDAAQSQGAFGGSRMYVQKAMNNDNFDRLRAETMAGLNSQNFGQAQEGAKFDIGNDLQTKLANQQLGANMFTQGAGGLSGLSSQFGNLGAGLAQGGMGGLNSAGSSLGQLGLGALGQGAGMNQDALGGLGNMANMGFGWGGDLEKRNLAAGTMQQQLNQQIINAIKGQVGGFTGQGNTGLGVLEGALPSIGGAGTTKQENNPGVMGILGGITSILGLL